MREEINYNFSKDIKIMFMFVPGPFGGAERVILTGLKALAEAHISCEILLIQETRVPKFCNTFIQELNKINVPYKVFTTSKRYDYFLQKEISNYINHKKVNIVHAHGIKAVVYSYLCKSNNYKLIVTQHGNTSHTLKVKLYQLIELFVIKRVDAVCAVSSQIKYQLQKDGIEKIYLLENMLSLKASTRCQTSNNILTFAIIARLSKEKGHLLLLKALRELKIPFKLHVLGIGSQLEKLQLFTKKYNLNNKIVFHGFTKNISPYLETIDCLIIPSKREGLPMILIESLCVGVPIIVSKVGVLTDFITNKNLQFKSNSKAELLQSINYFETNKESLIEQSIKDAPKHQQYFSTTRWLNTTLQIYSKVLSQE